MACNSCSKKFSLLRREKGCPSCGFSYCSDCLKIKIFIPKLNSEAQVCMKCGRSTKVNEKNYFQPPDAYYKRIGAMDCVTQVSNDSNSGTASNSMSGSAIDQEISDRLQILKKKSSECNITNEDIANRLVKIKGEIPSTSDAELHLRLANLRGVPVSALQTESVTVMPDNRTEQEQVNDLLKQYFEQTQIDGKYQDDFTGVIDNIQARLQKLKNTEQNIGVGGKEGSIKAIVDSEDEEDILNKIIEKAKAEAVAEEEVKSPVLDELPFCEICNEDANMRCCGCKYLFCKQCFLQHKDEDDGCDKYEFYKPPKSFIG